MSHEVETMAWTNQVPWHGLGLKVDGNLTAEQMLKAAKLNWKVEKRPIAFKNGGEAYDHEIDRFFALVRDSDNQCLDVVGNVYEPIQNAEAFTFFKEFVEAGKATMETAGSLKSGRVVWGLANLKDSFKLSGGDTVKGYLLVTSPHQQGKSMSIRFTSVRVVCNNTLTMALGSTHSKHRKSKDGEAAVAGIFKQAHRVKFDAAMIERAKETLGVAREQLHDFEQAARKLAAAKISEKDAMRFIIDMTMKDADIPHVMKDFDGEAGRITKQVALALTHAPGQNLDSAAGTLWGLVNAFTYTTDHLMSRNADNRLNKAWFGKTAVLKQRVLDRALEMV